MHEMHGKFDLLLKIRAKNLNQMRDTVENKICKIPHIFKAELMTGLKTKKEEEQIISLENDIEYKDMLYLNEDHLKSSSFSSLSFVGLNNLNLERQEIVNEFDLLKNVIGLPKMTIDKAKSVVRGANRRKPNKRKDSFNTSSFSSI